MEQSSNSTVKISFIFFILIVFFCFACTITVTEKIKMLRDNVQCAEITDYEMLDYVSQRFAETHNATDDYNCMNYSRDYRYMMAQMGVEVTSRTGCNATLCHRWVQVGVEPQTGELSQNEEYYDQTT